MTEQDDVAAAQRLRRDLQRLEPVPVVSEAQWQRHLERLGRRRRFHLNSVQLAACIAALVVLVITAAFLAVGSNKKDDGPAKQLPDQRLQSSQSCSLLSPTDDVLSKAAADGSTVGLQFAGDETIRLLCVRGGDRLGALSPDPAAVAGLLPFDASESWLVALPPVGTASVGLTTPGGTARVYQAGGPDFVQVKGSPVVAVPVSGKPAWVRAEFVDRAGKVLRLTKVLLGSTTTIQQAQRAQQSMLSAASAAATASMPPSDPGPDADFDMTSCLPRQAATPSAGVAPPEYWLALSCHGDAARATLSFGHGGTAQNPVGYMGVHPDDTKPFPFLAQAGSQTDVLVSAFTPTTATAVITLTDGSTITFGGRAHPWITLRSGWHGMIYRGSAANRAERVSTFDAGETLLGTQELYY